MISDKILSLICLCFFKGQKILLSNKNFTKTFLILKKKREKNRWQVYVKNHVTHFVTDYTAGWYVWGEWFLAVNHHNHKNWVPSILIHNLWLIFIGMKQKNFGCFWAYVGQPHGHIGWAKSLPPNISAGSVSVFIDSDFFKRKEESCLGSSKAWR